jgi:hypothetical protein
MRISLLIVGALLTGCVATVPPKVVTEIKTVEVQVPVRVPCLKAEEIPPRPTKVIKPNADYKGLSAGAVADLKAWETYQGKADAMMKGCL